MLSINIPKAIRAAAKKTGVTVSSKLKINPQAPLRQLSTQLQRSMAVPAFVVPPVGVSGSAAVSAAHKLLGTSGAKMALNNTQALAALGDPDAVRGLLALHTAQLARAQGRPIAAPAKGTQPSTFKRVYGKSEVYKLANKSTAANKAAVKAPAKTTTVASAKVTTSSKTGVTIWTRFKRWIGKKL